MFQFLTSTLSATLPVPGLSRRDQRGATRHTGYHQGPERQNPKAGVFDALRSRLRGPGGLYNIGNLIALGAGITAQILSMAPQQSAMQMVWDYLFGSPAATCLSVAILIFLASGEAYHRAWQVTGAQARDRVRLGDALSGVAAIFLTVALVRFGDVQLGLLAGLMLVIGKFGTAIFPERLDASGPRSGLTSALRILVVLSRAPSLLALGLSLYATIGAGGPLLDAAMATTMIFCYLLWLWADVLLWTQSRKSEAA